MQVVQNAAIVGVPQSQTNPKTGAFTVFMRGRSKIPAGIWVLGFVSLLMDISSEMIHALLPLFLIASLGASAVMIGLIEGVAEATALIDKVFPGVLSGWFLAAQGVGLAGFWAGGGHQAPVRADPVCRRGGDRAIT